MPPTSGPTMYTQRAVNCPATSAGPRARTGFTAPPVTGPATSTPTASAIPTAIGATLECTRSSVATDTTTKTSTNVTSASTSTAVPAPTPAAGVVAPSCAVSRPGGPKVTQVANEPNTAPTICAITYDGTYRHGIPRRRQARS